MSRERPAASRSVRTQSAAMCVPALTATNLKSTTKRVSLVSPKGLELFTGLSRNTDIQCYKLKCLTLLGFPLRSLCSPWKEST